MSVNIPVVTKYDPSGLRNAKKGFQSFSKSLKGLVGPAIAAVGFTSLASGITNSVKAAAADAKSQRLLARQLVTTTKATKKQVAGVEKFIDKTSMSVGIVDDELRPAFANLVRGTGSVSKAQKLLTIALDGSAASGKPLSAVTQALIKAQNGQLGGLYKLAPELKKTKGNLDDYAKSVTGAAEAAADPFAKLTVLTDNLSEKFGTILLPYVEKIVNFLINDVAPVVDKFLTDISNPNTEVGAYWEQLTDSIGKVLIAADKLLKSKVTQFLLELAGKVVIGALEVLTITLDKLASAFESLNDAMKTYNILTGQEKAPKLGTSENAKASQQILENLGGTLGINFMDLVRGFTPKFANGGIVMPKVGGSLATVAEAGQPEAIIPLNRLSEMMGGSRGSVYNITIQNVGSGGGLGQIVVDAIKGYERSNGTGWRR